MDLTYLLLSFFIVCVAWLVEGVLIKKKRAKVKSIERDIYYHNLTRDSLKMEEQEIDEQLILAKKIVDLRNQNDAIQAQFEDGEDYVDEDDDEEAMQQKLVDLQERKIEYEAIEQEICEVVREIPNYENETIQEQMSLLKAENEKLKSQLERHGNQNSESIRETDLDPKLLKYLEEHEELTLDFLEEASEALVKFKVSNPNKSFSEYIEELRVDRKKYTTELAQLRIAKKEAEIKYDSLKRNYEEEMKTLDETRVEYIIKNSNSSHYANALKAEIKIKEESVINLRSMLDNKQKEIDILRLKLQEATSQSEVYMKAWQEAAAKNQQFEAKEKAKQEREKRMMMNQSLNMSSASSYVENVIPPPQIVVPPLEELLGKDFVSRKS